MILGDFYTDERGRVRPISGKGGKGAGAATVVVVLAFGLAGAGGGVGGVGVVESAADSATAQSVRARTEEGRKSARKGQVGDALTRMGLRLVRKAVKQDLTCIADSFGQVREFFTRTPCRSLRRELAAIADTDGAVTVLSVAWVGMYTESGAERFKQLDDTDGTGNISPLGASLVGAAGVRFTGQHYASRIDGSLVVVAESAAGSGNPSAEVMDAIAQVGVELPSP
ncbi:hypothetical protein GCM10010174_58960 [Kutzneria viridogrisea]|uniref:PknH-like extracellular domain-containing protein n=1 Tax=Kutzneria viridogrisea TaxID=47990 RepID=A0ABR6BKS8_9PSEU|nr:hypothetical protein [Kutzneria viridogrisea]